MCDLCAQCRHRLQVVSNPCARCGLPAPADQHCCGPCRQRPPPWQRLLAPLCYQSEVSRLIQAFKFQQQLASGRGLSEVVLPLFRAAYEDDALPSLLIPVPLHSSRLRERGFNQAQLLAQWLARAFGLSVDSRHCQRQRATPSQQRLTAAERRHNLNAAFILSGDCAWLQGQHIALVDDVVTTMSTVRCLSTLLLAGGAARVDVWALARTLRD